MAVFSSKDFSGANTTRIRNMIAARTGVPAPATPQQCSDYVTRVLQQDTREHEQEVQRAAIVVTDPE
jgi:hypothetical protein